MNKAELREAFANKCKTRRKLLTITLDDGSTMEIAVRGLTVGQRNKAMTDAQTTTFDEENKPITMRDDIKMTTLMSMQAIRVPETDERVFDDRDMSIMQELPASVLDEVASLVAELSGSTKVAQAAALGNSDATPVAAPPSP